VAPRELCISRARGLLTCEVVRLEQREPLGAPSRRAGLTQAGGSCREQAAQPLAVEVGVEVVDRVRRLMPQLALRFVEIERDQRDAAAALETRVGLAGVGDEAVETGSQIRPEARLRRVERGEEVLFERPQEKSLRQIGRIVR